MLVSLSNGLKVSVVGSECALLVGDYLVHDSVGRPVCSTIEYVSAVSAVSDGVVRTFMQSWFRIESELEELETMYQGPDDDPEWVIEHEYHIRVLKKTQRAVWLAFQEMIVIPVPDRIELLQREFEARL